MSKIRDIYYFDLVWDGMLLWLFSGVFKAYWGHISQLDDPSPKLPCSAGARKSCVDHPTPIWPSPDEKVLH